MKDPEGSIRLGWKVQKVLEDSSKDQFPLFILSDGAGVGAGARVGLGGF